jgi:uncharacterized protein YecA (UPF0149 family)
MTTKKELMKSIDYELQAIPRLEDFLPYRKRTNKGKGRFLGSIKNHEPQQNRNEPCNCGSGIKFKKCCYKNIQYVTKLKTNEE